MTKQSFRMTTVTTAARICQMLSLLRRHVALPLSHSVPPLSLPLSPASVSFLGYFSSLFPPSVHQVWFGGYKFVCVWIARLFMCPLSTHIEWKIYFLINSLNPSASSKTVFYLYCIINIICLYTSKLCRHIRRVSWMLTIKGHKTANEAGNFRSQLLRPLWPLWPDLHQSNLQPPPRRE